MIDSSEFRMFFGADCMSVMTVAINDSLSTEKELPDYPALGNPREWRNIRDKRKLAREHNNAISSGREYLRAIFEGKEIAKTFEKMWREVDQDPSKSIHYRRRFSPRKRETGESNE